MSYPWFVVKLKEKHNAEPEIATNLRLFALSEEEKKQTHSLLFYALYLCARMIAVPATKVHAVMTLHKGGIIL